MSGKERAFEDKGQRDTSKDNGVKDEAKDPVFKVHDVDRQSKVPVHEVGAIPIISETEQATTPRV